MIIDTRADGKTERLDMISVENLCFFSYNEKSRVDQNIGHKRKDLYNIKLNQYDMNDSRFFRKRTFLPWSFSPVLFS